MFETKDMLNDLGTFTCLDFILDILHLFLHSKYFVFSLFLVYMAVEDINLL